MPSLCNHILKGIDQLQLSPGVLENLINDFGRMPDEEFLPLASFLLFFLSFFPWIARERRCCWSQVSNYGDVALNLITTLYSYAVQEDGARDFLGIIA